MFWEELYIRSHKLRNRMFKLLYKYLILNRKATLPGIGIFYIERKPARLDFANKVFVAPDLQIGFNPKTSDVDRLMYTFISNERKIDEVKAVTDYNAFADQLKENLNEHKSLKLPGIGNLVLNAEGELVFRATPALKDYFPDVVAERVLREHIEHNVYVGDTQRGNHEIKEMLVEEEEEPSYAKDYWWAFAIVLGIIGIGTIVYYYLHNGSLQ